ncbi:CHASE2 domain-containing protein [Synechococcus sp. W55.1]|uniref:CHASE2 domain-containing protein n=1 Tax=Synechococcus sp. W55.1 TaxID=2964512 RepID=UPI0039C1EAE3
MPDSIPHLLAGQSPTSPARPSPSRRRLGWALAWGLGWAALLNLSAQHPLLVRMESDAQEWLYAWRGPQQPSPEVVIVGIDGRIGLDRDSGAEHVPANGNSGQGESNGRTSGAEHLGQHQVDFLLERANYAGLTLRLLEEAEARVVVLNLPSSFVVPQNLGNENLDAPLRQVVQRYPDRLVLATRSSESFGRSEINIYNHFLPFSSLRLEYLVPPEHVQGVVQYRVDRAGILRQAQLRGLYLRRDSQEEQMFASVEALAFAKYDPERASRWFRERGLQPIQFNPLGSQHGIPIIPIERVCPPAVLQAGSGSVAPMINPSQACRGQEGIPPLDPEVADQLRDKIVLVGFVGGYPETFPVRTADGSQIAAVELQAQVLSSLLTGEVYQSVPGGVAVAVVLLLGVGTGLLLVLYRPPLRSRQRCGALLSPWGWKQQQFLLRPVVGLAVYEGWAVAQFLLGRWVWPLVLPALASGLTGVSLLLTLVIVENQERLLAQQQELERLRRAEQEAAIDQARKLLYRVATDIHDRELQELKVVMDDLESLQWQQQQGRSPDPTVYDHLLEQLERIGRGIRNQLNDVRTLAAKLRISPSLREGLHRGIEIYLDELIQAGSLTLSVERQLQPLQEPNTGEWLDQREDILRFLREAIGNVIAHVQPPKGNASFVRVSLAQTNRHCCLSVVNDGIEYAPSLSGGYGSKAMNTIARYLPKGSWHRTRTPEGHTHVELHWEMPL